MGNQIFITLHMDEPGGYIPSALFGDLLLDLCDGSAIKSIRQKACQNVCYWLDPRRQLCNRLAHGRTEIARSLSVHSSSEGPAYVSTGQPQVDVIGFVDHGVLDIREPGVHRRRIGDIP